MTPSNDNRPAEFDATVLKFLPLLRYHARRLAPRDPEDLVNDTVAHVLENWRAVGNHKPTSWLIKTMRGIASNAARMRDRRTRILDRQPAPNAVAACQEDAVSIDMALRHLPKREGDVLLKRAAGYELAEIGATYGVGKERVRQLEERARRLLANSVSRASTRRALAYGRAA